MILPTSHGVHHRKLIVDLQMPAGQQSVLQVYPSQRKKKKKKQKRGERKEEPRRWTQHEHLQKANWTLVGHLEDTKLKQTELCCTHVQDGCHVGPISFSPASSLDLHC